MRRSGTQHRNDVVGALLLAAIAWTHPTWASTVADDRSSEAPAAHGRHSVSLAPARLEYTAVESAYQLDPPPSDCVTDTITDTVFDVIHSFPDGASDGMYPVPPLVQTSDGNLYGLTDNGGGAGCGGDGCGTIFQIAPDGTNYTVLYAFAGPPMDGSHPNALILAADGNLYGITRSGGASRCGAPGCGTIFRIAPDGTNYTVLYAFSGPPTDADSPQALIQGADGNLYGTTLNGGGGSCGGGYGCGSVFRIATDGTGYSVVFAFTGVIGVGYAPRTLIQAGDSNLYGYASWAGACFAYGCAGIFQLAPDGSSFRIIHVFVTNGQDVYPQALLQATDGTLYGTTLRDSGLGCGGAGCGTVFRLATDGTGYAVLHTFTGWPTEGSAPLTLIQANDGSLYGVTDEGGSGICALPGCGTIFQMTTDGKEAIFHVFASVTDGRGPDSLIQAVDGTFYGTASSHGVHGGGVLFHMTLAFTLMASPDVVIRGDPFTVHFTAPGIRSPWDWIGFYPVGASNMDYLWGQYTNGLTRCSFSYRAPGTPGQYEFRYLLNNGFTDVVRSNTVTVR